MTEGACVCLKGAATKAVAIDVLKDGVGNLCNSMVLALS